MSISEPILSEFITREELAAELRRSPRTLDRWEVLGLGPPRTHIGRTVLYRRTSVQKWLTTKENHQTGNDACKIDMRQRGVTS